MALTIKIGDAAEEQAEETPEAPIYPPVTISLNIRKTIDGNVLIADHPDVDIAIIPKDKKIVLLTFYKKYAQTA